MTECVFCGIASGEIPANMVFHDDAFVAFNDISPKSPIHIVVIPRQHITSLCEVDQLPPEDRARMPVVLSEVARQAGLEQRLTPQQHTPCQSQKGQAKPPPRYSLVVHEVSLPSNPPNPM